MLASVPSSLPVPSVPASLAAPVMLRAQPTKNAVVMGVAGRVELLLAVAVLSSTQGSALRLLVVCLALVSKRALAMLPVLPPKNAVLMAVGTRVSLPVAVGWSTPDNVPHLQTAPLVSVSRVVPTIARAPKTQNAARTGVDTPVSERWLAEGEGAVCVVNLVLWLREALVCARLTKRRVQSM